MAYKAFDLAGKSILITGGNSGIWAWPRRSRRRARRAWRRFRASRAAGLDGRYSSLGLVSPEPCENGKPSLG